MPLGEPERGLDRVGQALLGRRASRDEPVDDHLDGVLSFFSSVGGSVERADLAVDPGPREALGLQLAEQVRVLALAAPHHRRQHLEPGALGQLEQPVDDLLRGLPRRSARRRPGSAAGRRGPRAGGGSRRPR